MDADDFTTLIRDSLDYCAEDGREELADIRVQTYDEVMVLTRDAGLVVTFPDGSQFYVTVAQTRS